MILCTSPKSLFAIHCFLSVLHNHVSFDLIPQGHMLTFALANQVRIGVSFAYWLRIQILVKLAVAILSCFLIPSNLNPRLFVRGINTKWLQAFVSVRSRCRTRSNRHVALSLPVIIHLHFFPSSLTHANSINHTPHFKCVIHADKSDPKPNLLAAGSVTIHSLLLRAATPAESFCCPFHASSPLNLIHHPLFHHYPCRSDS